MIVSVEGLGRQETIAPGRQAEGIPQQVRHVVGTAIGVDDARLRIGAHARAAEFVVRPRGARRTPEGATFDATERLNHVSPVVVEIPQLAVVFLMRPPERVLFEHLVLLEILPDSPAFVIS